MAGKIRGLGRGEVSPVFGGGNEMIGWWDFMGRIEMDEILMNCCWEKYSIMTPLGV